MILHRHRRPLRPKNNMQTVMVFGTFDGIHPGHESFLQQARDLGDRLVVSVASDKFVREIKKQEPLQSEQDRLWLILSHKLVDEAIVGDQVIGNFVGVQKIQPNIIALGYDQEQLSEKLHDWIKESGFDIKTITLKPHKPEKYKSSKLRNDSRKAVNA